MRRRSGFTLIELLIVVAIIAILAAIAVPNFLEAQVRAKVSRMKADLRTYAVGLEAYTVDNRNPPPGWHHMNTPTCSALSQAKTSGYRAITRCLSYLTTPVAYLTSLPPDVFIVKGRVRGGAFEMYEYTPWYTTFYCPTQGAWLDITKSKGYVWVMYSLGPARQANSVGIVNMLNGTYTITDPTQNAYSYDPSNGTVSLGWIVRTNKGEWSG